VDLRAVLEKIRPDFDLGAPGLREAWDRGDRAMFLVDTIDPPIRYTEGSTVGIKRGGSRSRRSLHRLASPSSWVNHQSLLLTWFG
jgi:hypothetical protein